MKNVVIVCNDTEYVSLIEYRIAEVFEKKAEIEILTEKKYIDSYFSEPRKMDLLIIQRELFDESIEKHNIEQIFIISDEGDETDCDRGNVHVIFKYESIRTVLEKIKKYFSVQQNDYSFTTKIVNVYSVSGDYNKTVTALSIANRLAKEGNKVLYINAESLQDFSYYLKTNIFLREETGAAMAVEPEKTVENILGQAVKNIFDYIPPLKKVLESYQITIKSYDIIIEKIKEKNIYDYIVTELPANDIKSSTMNLLCKGNKIVLLTEQTELAAYRLSKFFGCVTNIEGKCVLVVKNYNKGERDMISSANVTRYYPVCEYIEKDAQDYEEGYRMGLYEKTVKTIM